MKNNIFEILVSIIVFVLYNFHAFHKFINQNKKYKENTIAKYFMPLWHLNKQKTPHMGGLIIFNGINILVYFMGITNGLLFFMLNLWNFIILNSFFYLKNTNEQEIISFNTTYLINGLLYCLIYVFAFMNGLGAVTTGLMLIITFAAAEIEKVELMKIVKFYFLMLLYGFLMVNCGIWKNIFIYEILKTLIMGLMYCLVYKMCKDALIVTTGNSVKNMREIYVKKQKYFQEIMSLEELSIELNEKYVIPMLEIVKNVGLLSILGPVALALILWKVNLIYIFAVGVVITTIVGQIDDLAKIKGGLREINGLKRFIILSLLGFVMAFLLVGMINVTNMQQNVCCWGFEMLRMLGVPMTISVLLSINILMLVVVALFLFRWRMFFRKAGRQRLYEILLKILNGRNLWRIVFTIVALLWSLYGCFLLVLKIYMYKKMSLGAFLSSVVNVKKVLSFFFYGLLFNGSVNGANFMDGADGFLASTTIIYLVSTLFYIFYVTKWERLTVNRGVCIGGLILLLIVFLWFNKPKAKIFMGDTGSYFLGGSCFVLATLTMTEWIFCFSCMGWWIQLLTSFIQMGSIHFFGKKPFLMGPIHHHFEIKYPHMRKHFLWILIVFSVAMSTVGITIQKHFEKMEILEIE